MTRRIRLDPDWSLGSILFECRSDKKESIRWPENMRQATTLLDDPDRCLHIADGESDIYELFYLRKNQAPTFSSIHALSASQATEHILCRMKRCSWPSSRRGPRWARQMFQCNYLNTLSSRDRSSYLSFGQTDLIICGRMWGRANQVVLCTE